MDRYVVKTSDNRRKADAKRTGTDVAVLELRPGETELPREIPGGPTARVRRVVHRWRNVKTKQLRLVLAAAHDECRRLNKEQTHERSLWQSSGRAAGVSG